MDPKEKYLKRQRQLSAKNKELHARNRNREIEAKQAEVKRQVRHKEIELYGPRDLDKYSGVTDGSNHPGAVGFAKPFAQSPTAPSAKTALTLGIATMLAAQAVDET